MVYSRAQLRILARAYIALTKESESNLGQLICKNQKFVKGLLDGRDCTARNAELASQWFQQHWPQRAAWPSGVPQQEEACSRV